MIPSGISKHHIKHDQAMTTTINTLGITPSGETGYGYIQFLPEKKILKKVKTFTEKPELSLAKKFIERGFCMESGILFGVCKPLSQLFRNIYRKWPVFEKFNNWTPIRKKAILKFIRNAKSISIDYGIMESHQCLCEANFSWWSLGSWNSIHDISPKDGTTTPLSARHWFTIHEIPSSVLLG